jgi:hypothetical protein
LIRDRKRSVKMGSKRRNRALTEPSTVVAARCLRPGKTPPAMLPGVSPSLTVRVVCPLPSRTGWTSCSCLYRLEPTRNGLAMAVLWPWRARSVRRHDGGVPEPVRLGKAVWSANVTAWVCVGANDDPAPALTDPGMELITAVPIVPTVASRGGCDRCGSPWAHGRRMAVQW